MKRMYIFILFFILVALLISLVAFSVRNNVKNPEKSSIQQLHPTALEKSVIVQEVIKKYNLENIYAGVFIDDNGELNVNLVSDIDKVQIAVNQEGVYYHQVKHSYNKLNETMNILENKMIDLEITKLTLDVKKNKVIVTVKELNDEKTRKINQYVNPETVEYENAVGEIHLTSTKPYL